MLFAVAAFLAAEGSACRSSRAIEGGELAAVETTGPLRGWHYTATMAEDLARLDVRVCFEGKPPVALIPGVAEAAPYIIDVRTPSGQDLRERGDAWPLEALGDDACVDYAVDLAALVDDEGGRKARRLGDSLLVRANMWLVRPDAMPRDADVTLRFDLPEGVEVSVPWPRRGKDEGDGYALDVTVFHWLNYTVFGDVRIDRFEHAHTRVALAQLDAPTHASPDDLRHWLVDAIDSVALLYGGKFPRARIQVIVVPVEGGGGTIYFGMAARGGGSAIYVLLDDEATRQALPGGWTTAHELLHHGMPFVKDAWMAEGWVSYYTEITRTWMGHRDEAAGWEALYEAFRRGRRGGRLLSLQRTSDRMHELYAYQRVYWGGAAIAFFLDIAMRTETRGRLSMEDAMRELRSCCGDAEHTWTATRLLEHLDEWYGRPLFTETAQRYLRSGEFPDVDAAFAQLGITVVGDELRIDEKHPNAQHRRAIMAPRRTP